jgi:toxin ParE1/3/4
MKPFALTRKAKADLLDIANFTERSWGKEQRNLYIRQLDEAFHFLAETPFSGKPCDYIKPGYRKFPQGSHIVFYRAGTETTIEIIRILHKHMNVDSHL